MTRAVRVHPAAWGVLAAALLGCAPRAATPPRQRSPVAAEVAVPTETPAAAAANRFAWALYQRLALRDAERNLAFSPTSAALVLGMALAGARGDTAAELREVLGMTAVHDPHAENAALLRALGVRGDDAGSRLSVANRVWLQSGLTPDDPFTTLLQERYDAPLGQLDFAGALDESRRAINTWVAERTENAIPELLDAGSLDPSVRLVLTTAVHFAGEWEHPFDPSRTTEGSFASPQGPVTAAYMKSSGERAYARVRGAQLLELPYRGSLSLLIVLPDGPDGFHALESRLAKEYASWLAALERRAVHVALPRFRLRSVFELAEPLAELGVRRVFGAGADLSGISRDAAGLRIGTVRQETAVEVDERGTQAASATAAGAYGLQYSDEPQVAMNRPFLYVVRERTTGAVLFVGRVADPS